MVANCKARQTVYPRLESHHPDQLEANDMTWKVWMISGLVSQILSLVPAIYLALPTKTEFSSELGTITSVVEKWDTKQKLCFICSFSLVAIGAALQIVGTCLE